MHTKDPPPPPPLGLTRDRTKLGQTQNKTKTKQTTGNSKPTFKYKVDQLSESYTPKNHEVPSI